MSQFPHDEFVKEYLPELIKEYGEANSGENVMAQRREIDVFFQPNKPVPTTADTLGLLGKLAQNITLFEVFRNPIEIHQVKECLGKLFDVELAIKREKRKTQEKISLSSPFLWILTPTLGIEKLKGFRAETNENWPLGIYLLPENLRAGIVVIHQLPVNQETLWLRVLGKGKVQENAIDEIKALPKNHPNRDNILELVRSLFAILELKKNQGENLEQEDKELIMKLSPIYMERLAEREEIGLKRGIEQGLQQGIQQGLQTGLLQGKQEGKQEEASGLIIKQLQRKVGKLSPQVQQQVETLSLEQLEALGEALLDFNFLDNLIDWLDNNNDS